MAGDPFLSDPNRKRKRPNQGGRNFKPNGSRNQKSNGKSRQPGSRKDEEISSGEDSEDDIDEDSDAESVIDDDARNDDELDSDEEFEGENEADKRRRLAKQYLENLKSGELGDENDYDAQDLDDDIVARRLQVDVAEQKGHIYKFLGDKISAQLEENIKVITTRIGARNLTSMTVKYPNLYTVSKDCQIVKWNITGKPQRIKHTKGGAKFKELNNEQVQKNHHYDQITCIAISPDGKYVVTGGIDSRLIIWSSENLVCLKVLPTRTPVNAITFRRNTDQLYAACADLRIRTYSINQFNQLEILYGHQDNITDIAALARETCVSVGSRDKTTMFWKIAEETRLTFRGGDHERKKKKKDDENSTPFYNEGSIEVVSMNDESHFVTGSDNGNIALWSLAKKKPLFVQRLGHGLQPEVASTTASAEASQEIAARQIPQAQPYWITAIHAVPFSDVFITGSNNGSIKIWKIGHDGFRNFSLIGEITNMKGYIVKIETVEIPNENKLSIFVLTSKEHKFGRWFDKVEGGRNALVSFTVDI